MSNFDELTRASNELGIRCSGLCGEEARELIDKVLAQFKPERLTGHLSIGGAAVCAPLKGNEFSYSAQLKEEPLCVFFDQEREDKDRVFVIEDGTKLCSVLENSFGMEYFATNQSVEYLVAVNWYVIEGVGTARQWVQKLAVTFD